MSRKYVLYLLRWQLSTPVLAVVLIWLGDVNTILATVLANLIGGLIFFWVDKFIFRSLSSSPMWEIRDDIVCSGCGKAGRGYRITEWLGYDRKQDRHPEFRCEDCKDAKMREVSRKLGRKPKGP